jgi:trehalose 2-sulfotransferase
LTHLSSCQPRRGYVLCGYARTGSSLLCDALQATGRLGHAQEYFNPPAINVGHGPSYPRDPRAQLAEIARRGTTDNGIYGVKIFCDQFDALRGFDWLGALPAPAFIHLERRDALGQALSAVRAAQTGRWNGTQPGFAEPHYDERAILAELARFAADRARWQMFFARNGIQPMWLVYEDIVDALPQTVCSIAALVGITDLPDPLPHLERLPVQRDALNDDWRARFIASQGSLARLDRVRSARRPRLPTRILTRLRRR